MAEHSDHIDRRALPTERRIVDEPAFNFRRLSEFGVLWLINRVVFHPRGFTLALTYEDGNPEPVGWSILGDGTEPWAFAEGVDDAKFPEVEALLAQAHEFGKAPHTTRSDEAEREEP